MNLEEGIASKIAERVDQINDGAEIHALVALYYAADYTEKKNSWGWIYQRVAYGKLAGSLTGTTLSVVASLLWLLQETSWIQVATTFRKSMLALVKAIRYDIVAVAAQLGLCYIYRSDHLMVIGLGVAGYPTPFFYPFVDYGGRGQVILVLPKLYSYIGSAGIAGLIGIVLTEYVIGPILYPSFKSSSTNGVWRAIS